MATREDSYHKLRPFLWCAVSRRDPTYCSPHFHWSPVRPLPTVPPYSGHVARAMGITAPAPAQDFPNPLIEWGHPTYECFLRAYSDLDGLYPIKSREGPWWVAEMPCVTIL